MLARSNRTAAPAAGWVFFDCGLVDAAAALQHATGEAALVALGEPDATTAVSSSPRLGGKVYAVDYECRHAFADAIAEYERLCLAYTELDYDVVTLPRPRSRIALISPWRRCSKASARVASNVPNGRRSHGRLDHMNERQVLGTDEGSLCVRFWARSCRRRSMNKRPLTPSERP